MNEKQRKAVEAKVNYAILLLNEIQELLLDKDDNTEASEQNEKGGKNNWPIRFFYPNSKTSDKRAKDCLIQKLGEENVSTKAYQLSDDDTQKSIGCRTDINIANQIYNNNRDIFSSAPIKNR